MEIKYGDVVLIKGDDKHRGKWNIGIVGELYEGRGNIIRAVKLRSQKTYIEQPIQFLYPLELILAGDKKPFINAASNH